jgi:hypothetical protein
LSVTAEGCTGFDLMPPEATGITFTNLVPESRSLTNHILLNGSGVAAGDVDGDGWCDLFLAGQGGGSALYRNLGDWRFQNMTKEAGLDLTSLDGTGAVLADLDGDGDLDLILSSIRQGTHAFLNDGKGHFQNVTTAAGLASRTASMTLSLADIDGDGDLDLYVANYRNETLRDGFRMQLRVANIQGRRVVTMLNGRPLTEPGLEGWVTMDQNGNIQENGQADVLYRNQGNGTFVAASFTDGTFLDETGSPLRAPLFDWTLTAMFRDVNGDGAPDLYACSDLGSPDRIWLNRGDGHFQMVRPTYVRKTSWFSMGLDFGDLNRDGYDEFFVTDMVSRDHRLRQVQVSDHQVVSLPIGAIQARPQVPRNTLFLNLGDGDYAETAYFSGLDASEWSWSPVFLDVDLDGYEDVLIVTGFERDVQDADIANQLDEARRTQRLSDAEALRLRSRFPRLALPKLAFRNRGDLTFEESGAQWHFNDVGVAQGVALADLDGDGDLDVIVNQMNGPARLYRNESSAPRLAVRLRGQAPNTRGVGARIKVFDGAVPMQSQEMQCGGRYLSSDDPMRVFAAATPTNSLKVEVEWRSGKRSRIEGLKPNQVVEILEPSGASITPSPEAPKRHPIFTDISAALGHKHHEDEFDDFARQPLLPRKLSQLGPGVTWGDLDGDGWEDLLIGAGKGGTLAAFRNDGNGRFERIQRPPFIEAAVRDQTSILAVQMAPGKPTLVVGYANYEDARLEGPAAAVYDPSNGEALGAIAATPSSPGPLAVADYDGDGDLDLFLGGRVVAGRYPEPATSRLFKKQQGKLVEDESVTPKLRNLGLVSGAVWSDLDNDGFPELILACEWGPLRIFRNVRGLLEEWNPPVRLAASSAPPLAQANAEAAPMTLSRLTGWWNGVAVGDFDGDGRMDVVASNWGRNHKYQQHRQRPLKLYYGDFTDSRGVDLLEAYYEPAMDKVVPWQHLGRVAPALPFVTAAFPSFRQFGQASVGEILGPRLSAAHELEASFLETALFLNRGDSFEVRPLPLEAQLSPAFALLVADLDNDGREDLFLSQNFFATEPETGRYDAGRGLWLRGDGQGGFRAMPATETGVRVYGEQRGAALADFDHDGRVDLCVSQNGAPTCLFRNTGGSAGVRIRLEGPPGNPLGIGAQVRCGQSGPLKEVHAGSGYWSQDAATLVMAPPTQPSEVTVRWPGGKQTNAQLKPGTPELLVRCQPNALAR